MTKNKSLRLCYSHKPISVKMSSKSLLQRASTQATFYVAFLSRKQYPVLKPSDIVILKKPKYQMRLILLGWIFNHT